MLSLWRAGEHVSTKEVENAITMLSDHDMQAGKIAEQYRKYWGKKFIDTLLFFSFYFYTPHVSVKPDDTGCTYSLFPVKKNPRLSMLSQISGHYCNVIC